MVIDVLKFFDIRAGQTLRRAVLMICSVPFASGPLNAVHLQCQYSRVFHASPRFCIYESNVATLWVSEGTGRPCKCQGTIKCQDLDSSRPRIDNRRARFDTEGADRH